jgi:hypothetical protein
MHTPPVSHHRQFAIIDHILDRRFRTSEVYSRFGDVQKDAFHGGRLLQSVRDAVRNLISDSLGN